MSPDNMSRRHFRPIVVRMFDAELEEQGDTDAAKRKTNAAQLAKRYRLYNLRHTMQSETASKHAKSAVFGFTTL